MKITQMIQNRKSKIENYLTLLVMFFLSLAIGAMGAIEPALAKVDPNPYLLALEEAFVKVANETIPAVVSITAMGVVDETASSRPDPFREWHPPIEPQPVVNGSGFIFKKEGYILTSNHIVNGAEKVEVKLYDDRRYPAKVIGSDIATDIAVIKIDSIDKVDFPTLDMGNSDKIKVGQWAIAIGNPYQLNFTLTVGIISAKDRANLVSRRPNLIRYEDFIQTDAAINKGNSGGPLLNIRGEVVGVNSMIRASSPFDSGNIGIGFAVPINMAITVATQLINRGKVVRGWLGISMGSITEVEQKELKLNGLNGVKVDSLIKDSPAQKAGLQAKDIILEFDGKQVKDPKHLQWMVANTDVGKNVKLKIYRDQHEKDLNIRIDEMPAEYISTNRPSPESSVSPSPDLPPPSLRDRIPIPQRREQR